MEIQKIFSDMYDEERLYSVLMDEEELMLFSEMQKEFNSKAQKVLRNAFDIKQGLKNPGVRDSIRITKNYFPERLKDKKVVKSLTDSAKHEGRKISESLYNGNPSKINSLVNRRGEAKKLVDSGMFKTRPKSGYFDPNLYV